MKEKDQSTVCVEQEKDGTDTTSVSPNATKEFFDDSCFKAPLLLPPRKGGGRRRGSSIRNGQANNIVITPKRPISPKPLAKDVKMGPSATSIDSLSCSCSESYVNTLLIKDKVTHLKESIIDDFSLLMFKNADDLQAFQNELNAAKAKEEAEEKRRRYEENVRLGLIKKKGRKSKAQLEKERELERRRLRHEKKEQRRRERKERREREAREGTSVDSEERRLRRERKRERKERREREIRERELAGEERSDRQERKRKLKDPYAPKKPRQSRQSRSLGIIGAVPTETLAEGSGGSVATWMNDIDISVCSTAVPTITSSVSKTLRRSSDLHVADVGYEKRVKIEPNQEDHKNGLIGIAMKADTSAIMSTSPPRSVAGPAATRTNAIVTKADTLPSGCNSAQIVWNGQLPHSGDARDHSSSASVETTHPIDPGHDAPSTSVVAGYQQQPSVTVAPTINIPSLSSGATLGAPPVLSVTTSGLNAGRSELPSAAAVISGTSVDSRVASAAPPLSTASLLDPFRHAFFGGSNLTALNAGTAGSAVGASDFGNVFFPGGPPNAAAAAAFPFLAAQILQQQQAQQSMSLAQGSVPPSTLSAATQASTSTSAPSMGCIQFPPGSALGAALLGRALPTAATQTLSVKTKQGRWCAMHIKIAYEILSKKERRSTPQPATAPAPSQSSSSFSSQNNNSNTSSLRTNVNAPFCAPSTSNSSISSLASGFQTSFPALAQSSALPSPFILPFQQLTDPSKIARQSATPKQSQNRSTTAISRSPSTASGLHLQLGGGLMGPSMAAAAAAAAAAGGTIPSLQGSLPGALPGVLGPSLPLTPNLPGSTASITNGTSEAAAQAAMFAALQNAQQNAVAALPSGSISSAPYLLPPAAAAVAQQQHPLSTVTSQAQSVYSSQRLFDPSMTAVLQQMQSMEALRQSAAAGQVNPGSTAAGSHASVNSTSASIDLVRIQMEQQMMDRYMVALGGTSALGSTTSMPPTPNLEIMRQQLFAAQMRQQQQQQPSLEALFEMQRQQQQQQQLFNASRGLPSTYALAGAGSISGPAAAAAAAAMSSGASAGLPQSLGAAAGLFNSNLMSLGNAAAAANLQQALYNSGKNPYSNTLEQLARQKREEEIMQSSR